MTSEPIGINNKQLAKEQEKSCSFFYDGFQELAKTDSTDFTAPIPLHEI
jgi:hypothetical protein